MGLFSSKKKHYVDTSVMRVVEDKLVPRALMNISVENLIVGNDFMQEVRKHSVYGSFRKFEKMYRYAESGEYTYGLPNARVLSSSDGFGLAQAAIQSEAGRPVTLDYLFFRPLNNIHQGYKHLIDNMQYDPEENIVGSLTKKTKKPDNPRENGYGEPSITVYVEKMVAVHQANSANEIEATAVGNYYDNSTPGYTPETPAFGITSMRGLSVGQEIRVGPNEAESVEIHLIKEEASWNPEVLPVYTRSRVIVDLSNFSTDQEYYQARYRYAVDGKDVIKYWTYDPASNQYTALSNVFAKPSYVSPGTYFPFAVFRKEKTSMTDDSRVGTQEFKTTSKLLDYIGMDFKEMGDSLHENEDINDIEQAVFLMAVPLNTQHEIEIEYLYRYFKDLETRLPEEALEAGAIPKGKSQLNWASGGADTSYGVEISDADYRMFFSFEGIEIRLRVGQIGPVGTYTNSNTGSLAGVYMPSLLGGELNFGSSGLRAIRKQVTENIYEEIILDRPMIRWDIYGDKAIEGGNDDERFIIPLDYNIAKSMPMIKREELYYRSMHFVFNSRVTQKVKWYQTGAFAALIFIVAVVITVITQGATYQAMITAATGLTGATAMALAVVAIVVSQIVVGMVFEVIFAEVIDIVGIELAIVMAIASFAYGGYKGMESGEWVMTATAKNFLKASIGLVKGVAAEFSDMIANLQREMEAHTELMDEKWKELEELERELESGLYVNPKMFIGEQPLVVFGESPTDYFSRVAHSGNVGVKTLNIIEKYVDVSLKLPDINQTIGA